MSLNENTPDYIKIRKRLFISGGLLLLALGAEIFLDSFLISLILAFFVAGILGLSYYELLRIAKLFSGEKLERDSILASLSDGVIEYDLANRVILMNPKAEELFGVKFSDIADLELGPDFWESNPPLRAIVEVVRPQFAPYKLSRGGGSFYSEAGVEIHTSQPELRLFVVTKEIKDAAGKTKSRVSILRDISHEALLSQLKSEFVSVAAHQLRSPLAAVKWSLKLLLDGDFGTLGEKQKEFLKRSYETNERMIKLVNDLLNAARIEEGRLGYEFKEIDLIDFLERLVKNCETLAMAKKIQLKSSYPSEKIPAGWGDAERLSLAFSNLIENAINYTPEGGKVEVELVREGDFVNVIVSDTGVGIPKAEQDKVFSKFFRASNAIKLETEGTGLGLFIVRNIIKGHGGEITFSSDEGKGTTFTVLLPLKKGLLPGQGKALSEFLGV